MSSSGPSRLSSASGVSFKDVRDIDQEIDLLDKQINSGLMKLVDEKKALSELSKLRKQRKGFKHFSAIEDS
jgi:hypothetical protein